MKSTPPIAWLDLLWGKRDFEHPRGLYFARWDKATVYSYEQIHFTVQMESDRIWCLSMLIFGVAFHLVVDDPPASLPMTPARFAYRPSQLELRFPTRKDTLLLAWDDKRSHEQLKLDYKFFEKFDRPR